ncbi:MAG: type I-E CRISPR-associated protein Cse2/CasB [Fimbriimonadaceae bacterium]|nr:type I-E CRISPR-associated protein Cse2/CasB [Fimbriimonadaceae bacterium]
MSKKFSEEFVEYLVKLKRSENRGALAALRSGLGKKPGQATRMYPYVLRFINRKEQRNEVIEATFLTASLFAAYSSDSAEPPVGNLGASLRKATQKHGEEGLAKRLTALLDADREDVPNHLPGLVSLCASANAPIHWVALCEDIRNLLSPYEDARDHVRLEWAKHFWSPTPEAESDSAEQENRS